VGRVTAIVYDPSRKISSGSEFAAFTAVRIVDLRAELLPMDKLIDSAALDRYSFIRNAYLQRRQSLIEDRSSSPTKE
jgi:phospholipid-binding lipoprotein MlaA